MGQKPAFWAGHLIGGEVPHLYHQVPRSGPSSPPPPPITPAPRGIKGASPWFPIALSSQGSQHGDGCIIPTQESAPAVHGKIFLRRVTLRERGQGEHHHRHRRLPLSSVALRISGRDRVGRKATVHRVTFLFVASTTQNTPTARGAQEQKGQGRGRSGLEVDFPAVACGRRCCPPFVCLWPDGMSASVAPFG